MLFVGDDWAEDHHDIELVDDQGRVLTRRRFPEGIEGIAGLHALVVVSAGFAEAGPAGAAMQAELIRRAHA